MRTPSGPIALAVLALAIGLTAGPVVSATSAEPGAGQSAVAGTDVAVPPAGTPTLATLTTPRGGPATRSNDDGVMTYDVHVFALATPAGASPATPALSPEVVRRLDEEYDRETGGRYRFRFAGFQQLPAASAARCQVTDIDERYGDVLHEAQPGPGADGAIWVVVTAVQDACGYAGQAWLGAPGIHMNGSWAAHGPVAPGDPENLDVSVLAHEVGHNLGLGHAASVGVEGTEAPLDGDFWINEYGDLTDVMGSNWQTMRLNMLERTALGLVPRTVQAVGGQPSERFVLGAPDSSGGTKQVVLPVSDTRAYAVEYRPAVGSDWPLDGGWGTPGAGVFVRVTTDFLLRSFGDSGSESADWAVLPPASSDGLSQALSPGDTLRLPGGVRISAESVTDGPDGGTATVLVERPADTAAPGPAKRFDPCPRDERCVRPMAPARESIALFESGDDVWLSSVTVTVDGEVVAELDRDPVSPPEENWFDYSVPKGTHEVVVRAVDLVGNAREIAKTFVVGAQRPPSRMARPDVAVTGRRSATVSWQAATSPVSPVTAYVVHLDGGRGIRVGPEARQVALRRLGAGAHRVTVSAVNEFGNSRPSRARRFATG